METPRRYSESESSAILKQAAQDQEAEAERLETDRDGLTLAELKEAGRAAGISPKRVARAAASVAASVSTSPPKVRLGQPVSVAHAVDVPGSFTDVDWDALVQDLRHTFNAHGTVSQSSELRQWRNGNLRIYMEAAPGGHRIHFYTLHGVLQSRLDASLVLGLAAPFFLAVLLFASDMSVLSALAICAAIGLGAAGFYGFSAYQLPRWRRARKEQMKAIAGRMLDRAAREKEGTGSSASEPPSNARSAGPADAPSSNDA